MAKRVGTIKIKMTKGTFHNRSGEFVARCKTGSVQAASKLADIAVAEATKNRAASKYKFTIAIFKTGGGGGTFVVKATGRFAAMLEHGSPRHPITGGGPEGWMTNPSDSSHWPSPYRFRAKPKTIVDHPGLRGIHYMEEAGDTVAQAGPTVLAEFMP